MNKKRIIKTCVALVTGILLLSVTFVLFARNHKSSANADTLSEQLLYTFDFSNPADEWLENNKLSGNSLYADDTNCSPYEQSIKNQFISHNWQSSFNVGDNNSTFACVDSGNYSLGMFWCYSNGLPCNDINAIKSGQAELDCSRYGLFYCKVDTRMNFRHLVTNNETRIKLYVDMPTYYYHISSSLKNGDDYAQSYWLANNGYINNYTYYEYYPNAFSVLPVLYKRKVERSFNELSYLDNSVCLTVNGYGVSDNCSGVIDVDLSQVDLISNNGMIEIKKPSKDWEGLNNDCYTYANWLYKIEVYGIAESGHSSEYVSGESAGYSNGNHDGYISGYLNGQDYGYDIGYSNGYSLGDSVGFDRGYNNGYGAGKTDGYNSGQVDGYNSGQVDGYNSGQVDGYNSGQVDGYNSGQVDGYNSGQSAGYEIGHYEGLQDAPEQLRKDSNAVKSLFPSLLGSVLAFISSMFGNMTVFGVSGLAILITVATAVVVLKIWKG